jgi:peroxiredoxin
LEQVHGEFKALGASLLLVSPQTEEHIRAFVEEKRFSMEMLSDPGNRTAEKYGLVYTYPEDLKKVYLQLGMDLEKYNGDASWRLPMPARYIIDRDSTIRYAQINPDHTSRPEPQHTIEALKKIR